jgi:Rod binding domain-containing protein
MTQLSLRFLYGPLSASKKISAIRGIRMTVSPIAPAMGDTPRPPSEDAALAAVAEELEASFLEEMLKHAGFRESRGAFGGGAGEEQFASLLRQEHARAIAAQGGIGLAESLFHALTRHREAEE